MSEEDSIGYREIILRAGSGFYYCDFLDYLEIRRVLYAIVVKLYLWIQMELVGLEKGGRKFILKLQEDWA